MPAPPPNGVSSTCPHFSGVLSRKSTASMLLPSRTAFSTWRCVRNHSNHCGNSVKTSALTEEAQVDVDPARLDVDRADAVTHQRHQQLRAVHAVYLEDLDGRQCAHLTHEADLQLAVDDEAAFEIGGPVFVFGEHRGLAGNGQVESAQGLGILTGGRALQAQD